MDTWLRSLEVDEDWHSVMYISQEIRESGEVGFLAEMRAVHAIDTDHIEDLRISDDRTDECRTMRRHDVIFWIRFLGFSREEFCVLDIVDCFFVEERSVGRIHGRIL